MSRFPQLTKLGLDREGIELFKEVLAKMRRPSDAEYSALASVTYINSQLPLAFHVSESTIKTFVDKGIFYARIEETGIDSIGRKKVTYNIPQSDLDNYIAMMEILMLAFENKLIQHTTHPETGAEVIMHYQPIKQTKIGLGKVETKLSAVTYALRNPVFADFILSLKNYKL